jgi:putative aminopeptidase FrvX
LPRTSISLWAAERRAAATLTALGTFTLLASSPQPLRAQDTSADGAYARAVATWITLLATPGYEQVATDRITTRMIDQWTRDVNGNLIKRVGDGAPRRVVACGLDESGYAVSQITDDGYLRVHMNGNERRAPLWHQFHEGQRVVISAVRRDNPDLPRMIPGVIATRSNHLWRGRAIDESPATIEELYVDVGARSRADAEKMGIAVLDPVVRDWPEWTYAGEVAGPGAANRAGCAAVAAAAASNSRAAEGETIYVLSTQKSFSWTGLTSALARLGRVDSLFLVDETASGGSLTPRPVRAPWPVTASLDVGAVLAIGVPVKFGGTLVESIGEADLESLHRTVAQAAGIGGGAPSPVTLPHGWTAPPPVIIRDSLSKFADLLGKLADIYAVSGSEQPMRDAIRDAMPEWARDSAVVDTAGNLVVALGPDRDTTVFIAHMDEIGFLVSAIAPDGTVSLRTRGTFFPYMWEGQTALLHRPGDTIPSRRGPLGCGAERGGPLRGVFIPRDSATTREPRTVTAWFGLTADQLAAEGVHVGSPVTSYKCSARLGAMRLTARSVDDRAGDTALLLALGDLDRAKLDHKVIFVWSVREEGGLEGAKALAATLGPSVHRVHAVDTFVSSDSPLESPRFAHAEIGDGAVVRALDNSSVTPPAEIDRVLRVARAARIPVQAGVTNGGNDGSEFAHVGAINVSLAWPLRYSHSPAEVIDLRDLHALTRIIAAVANAPTASAKKPPAKKPSTNAPR